VGPEVALDILRQKKFHVLEFKTRTAQCIKYERKSLEIDEI